MDYEDGIPVVESIFDSKSAVRTLGKGGQEFLVADLVLYCRRFQIARLHYTLRQCQFQRCPPLHAAMEHTKERTYGPLGIQSVRERGWR